jgi:ABC-2 type transport system ATP-binding protein
MDEEAGDDGRGVSAQGLVKTYGSTRALDGFDLEVEAGRVCGLLGPNGAGKTTAVRILATLLRPDGGQARVAGADVIRQPGEVRRRIGLSGQSPAVDEILSGRQNLVLFGRLNRLGKATARRRADELLERMDLVDAADKAVKHYSGGMRRRLDLAATLILSPAVLFLDEPTTGLDPRNRNEVWSAIRELVAGGTTVLLTTQYLDEADQLADQIVVIDGGRDIAQGTPEQLKAEIGGDRLDVVVADPADLATATRLVAEVAEVAQAALTSETGAAGTPGAKQVSDVDIETDPDTGRISVPVAERVTVLTEALHALRAAGIEVIDVGLRRPTLDDVFLRLTGHRAERGPSVAEASGAGIGPEPTVSSETDEGEAA